MSTLLLILHVIVCLSLIAIVLLQGGKGADIGATFGAGSSQTVFGATGSQSFLGKLTAGAAVIFMLTSLLLAYFYATPGLDSIMPSEVKEAPLTEAQPSPTAKNAAQAPADGQTQDQAGGAAE